MRNTASISHCVQPAFMWKRFRRQLKRLTTFLPRNVDYLQPLAVLTLAISVSYSEVAAVDARVAKWYKMFALETAQNLVTL